MIKSRTSSFQKAYNSTRNVQKTQALYQALKTANLFHKPAPQVYKNKAMDIRTRLQGLSTEEGKFWDCHSV